VGPWRLPADSLQSVARLVVWHSWPFARPRGCRPLLRPCLRPGRRWPLLRLVPPPVRFVASSTRPARGIHFPANRSHAGFHRPVPTSPRRGLPTPLRSAFAVSHDLDGLLLLEPCGVFHPLTPLRFAFPAPRFMARIRRPEDRFPRTRGTGSSTEGSRLARGAGAPKRPFAVSPPLRSPKRTVRLRLPSACACRSIQHPPACAGARPVPSPGRVAPSRSPCWQASTARTAKPRYRGCLSRGCTTLPQRVTAAGGRSRREQTLAGLSALTTGSPLEVPAARVCRLSLRCSASIPRREPGKTASGVGAEDSLICE
jgi:hypothetical protein